MLRITLVMRLSASNVTAGSPRVREMDRQFETLPVPTMRSMMSWRKPVRGETGGLSLAVMPGLNLQLNEN